MPRWREAVGGLIVWTIHFAALYALVSLEAQFGAGDSAPWRTAAIGVSLACAAACAVLALRARSRLRAANGASAALVHQLALLGAGVALIGIVWQTMAVLLR